MSNTTNAWTTAGGDDSTFAGQRLNDRMGMQANVVTGNLAIRARDLSVTGTGLDLTLDRTFNSLSDYNDDLARFWSINQGYDIQLTPRGDGSITLIDGSGAYYRFGYDAVNSRWVTPPGLDATPVQNLDGTYTLTYHVSGTKYTFSTDGWFLQSITDKNGNTITYTYDDNGTLTTLTEPGSPGAQTTFTYDGNGNRTATNYPNGMALTRAYDTSQRLATIVGKKGATTYSYFQLTYGKPAPLPGGQATDTGLLVTSVDNQGRATNYTYDAVNRLTGAIITATGGATVANYQYTYNGNGNRLTATLNGTSVFATPTYNAVDELTALGTATLGYDGTGNETGRSSGLTAFAYNGKDQTTSITNGGSTLAMTYAGDSQVQRRTAGTSMFGDTVLGLSSEQVGANTTYYVRDNSGRLIGARIPNGSGGYNAYYYLFDGLGSVIALTDGTGAVHNTYSYDPYGQVTAGGSSPVANPWQYTGGYRDATTGLVKLGQHFYDPELPSSRQVYTGQRFISCVQTCAGWARR